jgi:hypothetical protein
MIVFNYTSLHSPLEVPNICQLSALNVESPLSTYDGIQQRGYVKHVS